MLGAVGAVVYYPLVLPTGLSDIGALGPALAGNPYDVPIMATNRHLFLTVEFTEFRCTIDALFDYAGGGGSIDIESNTRFTEGYVEPRTTRALTCKFGQQMDLSGREIQRGELILNIAYRHLWNQHIERRFVWDRVIRQWLETEAAAGLP